MKTFLDCNLDEYLQKAIEKAGFEELTPIQQATISPLREGKDVIGKARTGSGKTIAFAIPASEKVEVTEKRPQILIIEPTRELAAQVTDEIRKLNEFREGCAVVPVMGGTHMDRQISALKRGPRMVVGTPGRLCDHLRRRTLDLSAVRFVVLDEADEMLDMGFRPDVDTILGKTPADRQTALFSATMPPEVLSLAKAYLTDPITIEADRGNQSGFIEQYYLRTGLKEKNIVMRKLLDTLKPTRCIIFCNTKSMVDSLYASLIKNEYSAVPLHGDIRQNERKKTLKAFKEGQIPVMIATDVAARGLDISGLDAVFNYDVPQTAEYYTHRIGRTGRAGKSGKSYTLINTDYQQVKFEEILTITGNQVQALEGFSSALSSEEKAGRKDRREQYLQQAREKHKKTSKEKETFSRKTQKADGKRGKEKKTDEVSLPFKKPKAANKQKEKATASKPFSKVNKKALLKKANKDKGKPHGKKSHTR